MSDLLNKTALIAAVDALLNNGVADESITPQLHNDLVQDVIDTIYTALWKKSSIVFGDFSGDAALTANKVFRNLAAGHLNGHILMHVSTAFVGPGLTALTVTAGTDASPTFWGSIDGFVLDSEKFSKKDFIIIASATDLKAFFTAVGANLDTLTAGQLDIYYLPQQVIS